MNRKMIGTLLGSMALTTVAAPALAKEPASKTEKPAESKRAERASEDKPEKRHPHEDADMKKDRKEIKKDRKDRKGDKMRSGEKNCAGDLKGCAAKEPPWRREPVPESWRPPPDGIHMPAPGRAESGLLDHDRTEPQQRGPDKEIAKVSATPSGIPLTPAASQAQPADGEHKTEPASPETRKKRAAATKPTSGTTSH